MTTKSKNVRAFQKARTNCIIYLRNIRKLSWLQIAKKLNMDKNNARRTYMRIVNG
jgi:hypothetical protein